MPTLLSTLCPGSHWPDYRGGSLLNLTASLSTELGGPQTDIAKLSRPWLAGIGQHRHVVLILIDGLGSRQLAAGRAGATQPFAPASTCYADFGFPCHHRGGDYQPDDRPVTRQSWTGGLASLQR